jgi:glutamate/tyrosine decarboxylase-like PLP-dependent enzyme
VLAGQGRHGTIDRALRFLGVGAAAIEAVEADAQGRMRPAGLASALERGSGPAVVCAQLGNVNSGALDPVGEICRIAHGHGAWVHVDGAFGMWAAASPRLRPLVAGVERADSWATDAHKWLNVPYDSGLVFCAHPEAHRAAMGIRAGYLLHGSGDQRDALDYNPEHSRRARGLPAYAAIRALGRQGVAELVERCCGLAVRFAERLAAADGVEVLNQVVLNQVLVRFLAAHGDHDAHTRPGDRAGPAGRHLLDERHHLAGPGGHAHLGVQLVDRRGRRRPGGGGRLALRQTMTSWTSSSAGSASRRSWRRGRPRPWPATGRWSRWPARPESARPPWPAGSWAAPA